MRSAAKPLLWFAFLLVAGTVLVLAMAYRAEQQTKAAYPPAGQFVEVDGLRVHVQVAGSGPDLVLIHGSSGHGGDFTMGLMQDLAKRYRVIALDRPGLGHSDPIRGGGTIRQQAEILQKAAAQLGAEMPIVLGHSYGGAVALAWGVYLPDHLSALVTVAGPSHPWDTPLDPVYRLLTTPVLGAILRPVLTAFVPESYVANSITGIFAPQTAPEGYAAHFGPGLSLRRSALKATSHQRANLLGEITDMMPHYRGLTVPLEIVHGTVDTIVGLPIHAAKMIADTDQANLTPLEGIGHMPHHVAPDAVVDAIDRAAFRAALH